LAEAYRFGAAVADRPEIRSLSPGARPASPATLEALHDLVVREAYSIPHVVGTCAMGRSPDEGGVVDHRGRVHGVEGLFVADASVIPDAPAGFPHLVTMMLAEHLSEHSLGQG
jgi:choline dehydrogenase